MAVLTAEKPAHHEERLHDLQVVRALLLRDLAGYRHRDDFEDLIQTGLEAAVKAATRFDPDRASFSTFAMFRARGAISDYLRHRHRASRISGEQRQAELSLDAHVSADDDTSWVDLLEDPSAAAELDQVLEDAMSEALLELVHRLPSREAYVVICSIWKDMTLQEIGDSLGVTASRVCQLRTEALRWLRPRLQSLGVAPA